jgi:uncharacterized protein YbjT (DUF2867 family)
MTFVITGATGNTGGVAAKTLLQQGHAVRVVVRDRAKAARLVELGAEVAIADIGDAAALASAFAGAKGVYVLVPPNMAAPSFRDYQRATADAIAQALRTAEVPHAVLLSSVGAQHPSGTGPIAGLHYAETLLRALPHTRASFIRAAYFMENLGGSLSMLDQGVVPSFTPAGFAFDMIATADIGELAAQTLVEGTAQTQIIELAGPSPVSTNDVVAALGRLTGKPLQVAEAPLDAMVPTLTGLGMPAEIAGMYREMTEGLLSGHVAFEGGHRTARGKTKVDTVLKALLGHGH